jgi:hypothetical protein
VPDNRPSLLDCVVICEADERVNVSSLRLRSVGGLVRAEWSGGDGENATRYATVGMQMLGKGEKVSLDRFEDKKGSWDRGWKLKLTFRCQLYLLYLGGE